MLAGAGGVDHGSLVKLAEDHFKGLGIEYEGQTPEVAPCRFTGESFGDFNTAYLNMNGKGNWRLASFLYQLKNIESEASFSAHGVTVGAILSCVRAWTSRDCLVENIDNVIVIY